MKTLNDILNPIIDRTISFLKEEMGVSVDDAHSVDIANKLKPYENTAMIGIGGTLNLMFLMSYEDKILIELVTRLACDAISDDELQEFKESACLEIANIVLGNSIPHMPNGGKGVTITPPLSLDDCKRIAKTQNADILKFDIKTQYGMIMLAVIGNSKEK